MDNLLRIKTGQGPVEVIDPTNLKFHPVLKDIENIFWLFLLSNKALSLCETQVALSFDQQFSALLNKYNEWTGFEIKMDEDGKTYTANSDLMDQMIFYGKAIAILTYDFVLASKYNSIIGKHPSIQFIRHIRNGAAHYNQFNLKNEKHEWKIKESEVIEWRDKKVDRSLHRKQVFPNFISVFDVFLLAKDLSGLLDSLDVKK